MIKAMKKLKFWSRKKKKKKKAKIINVLDPSPSTYHCCHLCSTTEPSAPPLPSWYDLEQSSTTVSASSSSVLPQHTQFTPHENVPEATPLPFNNTPSYQQYMVPDPVYGVPLVPAPRTERAAGLFGCAVNIGTHLIHCFCPCFRFRDLR